MRLKSFFCLFGKIQSGYKCTCFPQAVALSFRTFSQWDLVGAVCLERKPVISQSLTPLEQRYLKYLQELEVEKSLLSEHEKRHIEDKRVLEKLKTGALEDTDAISKQTAQDFEDACQEEFNKFTPGPRITEADKINDKHSTQRKLDSSLVFLIQQKLGNDFKWLMPQAVHKEGETLQQTAERALFQTASCNCAIQFMGNAPVGFYKYKYPKATRENGVCGAKVFFFKAQLVGNPNEAIVLKNTDLVKDYLWLTHAELEEVVQPQQLLKTIQSFLYPDVLNCELGSVSEDEREPVSVHSQG